mgnify:CR=1 FL=1
MFSKLFKNKQVEEVPQLSPGIRESMMTFLGTRGIPPMPNSAQKAFKLTVDPNATATDFVEVIESDEALSARIVKISNSVYFDRGTPSRTIEESVNKIGLNELRCLLNANTLPELLPSANPLRAQLWLNDIATAIFARNIAAMKCPALQGTAFLGGLMHDIGKLLLLQRLDEDYAKIVKEVQLGEHNFCSAEEEHLPFNHCQLGQLLAEKWNFGPDLMTIIREHHEPWNKLNSNKTNHYLLTTVVKAADIIAHSLGIGHATGFASFRERNLENLDEALGNIGIPASQKKSFLERCHIDFESESEIYLS